MDSATAAKAFTMTPALRGCYEQLMRASWKAGDVGVAENIAALLAGHPATAASSSVASRAILGASATENAVAAIRATPLHDLGALVDALGERVKELDGEGSDRGR